MSKFLSFHVRILTYSIQVDCRKVAELMNLTYDQVENRTRKMKKDATAMIEKTIAEGRMDETGAVNKDALASPKSPRGRKSKVDALHGLLAS